MGAPPLPTRARQPRASFSTDYPPDMVWYEPGENLGSELLHQYEQSLAEEAAAVEASAREDAEIIDLEMPVVEHSRVSSD
eukprot:3038892-Pleurochrysis_carterae.AAC.1